MNDFHLEDDFHDIIAKAQEGLKLRDKSLARQAGVTVEELTPAIPQLFGDWHRGVASDQALRGDSQISKIK